MHQISFPNISNRLLNNEIKYLRSRSLYIENTSEYIIFRWYFSTSRFRRKSIVYYRWRYCFQVFVSIILNTEQDHKYQLNYNMFLFSYHIFHHRAPVIISREFTLAMITPTVWNNSLIYISPSSPRHDSFIVNFDSECILWFVFAFIFWKKNWLQFRSLNWQQW